MDLNPDESLQSGTQSSAPWSMQMSMHLGQCAEPWESSDKGCGCSDEHSERGLGSADSTEFQIQL